jgi:hypothetical protein
MTDRMERQQREFEERLQQLQDQYEHDLERFRRIIRKMDKIASS